MNAVLARLPGPALDPKRIAANSAVICLHVAVLMALLLPQKFDAPASTPDNDMIVVPVEKIVKPIDPPKPVVKPVEVKFQPTILPKASTPDDAAPVVDDPGPVDVYQPEVIEKPATDYGVIDSAPVFAQLSADRSPAPPYPRAALQRRLTGTVTLRILVGTSGEPLEVSVENSSGHRVLDEAARKFVLARWHFVPAQQGGVAISAYARVPINFTL